MLAWIKALMPRAQRSGSKLQYAALPFRRRADVGVEVLLITTRETGRWIIPKGWPIPGLSPQDSAAHEAREEGGLIGRIGEMVIGRYHYDKRLASGSVVRCAVDVFLLEVSEQMKSWPEQRERRTRWFAVAEAAGAVEEPELRDILRGLAKQLA